MITRHGWHLQAEPDGRFRGMGHAQPVRNRAAGEACAGAGGGLFDIDHMPRSWLLVVNASNTPRDRAWLESMNGFEMVEPGVPRFGYPILVDGRTVGPVTTGLFSPSTGKYLGMGYVEVPRANVGEEVGIVIREAVKTARIVKRPFYTSPHWR
jgi:Glycine cleavage T-protein C-terminal barrel domain